MNNSNDFCDIFNGYFTNVAIESGSEKILNGTRSDIQYYQNHANIARIQEHVSIDPPFKFTNVSIGE